MQDKSYKNKPQSEWTDKDWADDIEEFTASLPPPKYNKQVDFQEQSEHPVKTPIDIKLENINKLENQGTFKNLGYGILDAIQNQGESIANLIPSVNFKPVQRGSGRAYTIGDLVGNVVPLLVGGGLAARGLTTVAKAAEESPSIIGNIAKWLGKDQYLSKMTKNALGNAAYAGATQGLTNEPNESGENARLRNALLWGGGSAVLDSIMPALRTGASGINKYLSADANAKSLMKMIEGGENLTDLPKKFIGNIKDVFENKKAIASNKFNDFFNRFEENNPNSYLKRNIKKEDDMFPYFSDQKKADYVANLIKSSLNDNEISKTSSSFFKKLSPDDIFTDELKKAHTDFLKDPTLRNAHFLSSKLGTQRRILKNYADPKYGETINRINTVKSDLDKKIDDFFKSDEKKLPYHEEYKDIKDYYRENVAPFFNKKISKYSYGLGKSTNESPEILANKFKAPTEDINKVINYLSEKNPNAIKNLLYMKLGMPSDQAYARGLINKMNYIENKGFGDYLNNSPEIKERIQDLENTKNNRSVLFKLLSMAAGPTLAHKIGVGGDIASDIASAGFGLAASSPLEKSVSELGSDLKKMAKSTGRNKPNISNNLGSLKDILKASFKSSVLPKNQQPYKD